jgi:CheY-like chemotaxis protein
MSDQGTASGQHAVIAAGAGAKRILVVDDEESIRELFTGLFRPPVYALMAAASGEEAVEMAKTNLFDLAYIDVMMPGCDGVECSRQLRQMQPALKTVLISGYVVEDRARAVERAGAQAFLAKPFTVAAVRSLAERLLGLAPRTHSTR